MRASKIVALFFVLLVFPADAVHAATGLDGNGARELVFRHPVSELGIFDPSIAEIPQGHRFWMSYSAVDPPRGKPVSSLPREVTTRLAYSDDGGRSWSDAGAVNSVKELNVDNKPTAWINETSSLLHDPTAPPGEQWKLFWHHYLRIGKNGHFQDGWIGYKGAATPEGLVQAQEVKLFVGRAYNDDDNGPSSAERSPLSGPPAVALNRLNRDLRFCAVPTEPGALVTSSGIYMSMVCETPNLLGLAGAHPEIILLKCRTPCRPAVADAWTYIATLFDDAFSGPSLFSQNGQAYLLATPISDAPWTNAYNGCNLYRFANFDAGMLEKNAGGDPHLIKHFEGAPRSFNGACTYAASAPGSGLMLGQVTVVKDIPTFHILLTDRRPVRSSP